jgi:hypothetical protein
MLAITWKEIQKNGLTIGAFLVLSIGLVLAFNNVLPGIFSDVKDMLDVNYALLMGIWITMLIFSALMAAEKEEDQNNGYEFYKILPVSDTQIVLGKYLGGLLYMVVGTLLLLALMYLIPYDVQILLNPVAYLFTIAGISLVLVGALYPLCFRWGYSRVMGLVVLVYIGAMMLPSILHLVLLITNNDMTVEQIFAYLTIPTGLGIMGGCLVIYGLLAWRAIKVKEKLSLNCD